MGTSSSGSTLACTSPCCPAFIYLDTASMLPSVLPDEEMTPVSDYPFTCGFRTCAGEQSRFSAILLMTVLSRRLVMLRSS